MPDFDNIAALVHAAVAAVCPIHGVSIGRKADKTTWRIDFADDATEQQKLEARLVKDNFDLVAKIAEEDAKRQRSAKIDVEVRRMAEAELIRRGEITR